MYELLGSSFPKKDLEVLVKLFVDSNRGLLITMRALAICTEMMSHDDFKGDLEIVQDRKDMKKLLEVISRLYRIYDESQSDNQKIDMAQVLGELGQLFPNEKWDFKTND
jgi:hypothetical protein